MSHLQKMIEQVAAELTGYDEGRYATVYGSYSGRAMYGRNCPAITGSMQACQRLCAEVLVTQLSQHVVLALELDDDDLTDEQVQELEQKVRESNDLIANIWNFRTDSMGGDIVMYWPDQEYVEPKGDAAEEQG